MSFHLNLRSLVYSLSDALDLVGVDELHHGKRVASMAVDIARTAGFNEDELDDLFIASLLHDCGVSTTKTFKKLNTELEWEGAADHCERGYELLKTCDLLSKYADVVRYHHTPWEELGQMGLDRKVIDHANCIYLADRVDALLSQHAGYQMVGVRDTIRDTIIGMSDRHFSSVLVMAFVDASVHDSFWLDLSWDSMQGPMLDWVRSGDSRPMDFDTIRQVAEMFSTIVDTKSGFTRDHSRGVARTAAFLGDKCGLNDNSCRRIEIAGLLHDIGKLRVPDHILDKPMTLTRDEFSIMQRHSFDTFAIIGKIHGMEDIAQWAGDHHTKMREVDDKSKLSLEARILAVADVFQALSQDRPYRKAKTLEEAMEVIDEMVNDSQLDSTVVACLHENQNACWEAATA
jgi:HD-GYP domain-containing protein (c-di-GMP phosphodiesterase class II)